MAGARRRDAPTGWPVGVQKKPVLDPFGYRTLTRWGRSTLTPAAAHDELVFTMPGGSVVRLSNWRRVVFIPARARAGTSDRFRVHDLRHTAASLMIQAGYPPKMLQEILGTPASPRPWTCTGTCTPARWTATPPVSMMRPGWLMRPKCGQMRKMTIRTQGSQRLDLRRVWRARRCPASRHRGQVSQDIEDTSAGVAAGVAGR